MLKYTNYEIIFQEVPNEVTLCFNISNCHIKCKDCHSKFLWEDIGEPLIKNLINIIDKYKDYITCVCFMGGTNELDQLQSAVDIVKTFNMKACVYTGEDYSEKFDKIIEKLDFIKFGPYIEEFGGLDKNTTNQKFYTIKDGKLEDKTYLFWKENREWLD